jgi:hypothetical protein
LFSFLITPFPTFPQVGRSVTTVSLVGKIRKGVINLIDLILAGADLPIIDSKS